MVATLVAVLGLLVVAPLLLSSIAGIREAADYTPTYAGRRLISDLPTFAELDPWTGYAVLVGWAVVALVVASLALRARDA